MSKKKTHQEFIDEIFNLVGTEYSVLEEYKNTNTKIRMRHNVCGYEWDVTPNHFIYNNSCCPKCFGTHKKTTEQYKQEVFDLVGNEYSVLGEYLRNKCKIKMRHNCVTCNNHEWDVLPNNFLHKNSRCPKCNMIINKNTEQYKQEFEKIIGTEYTVLGEYVNANTKIKMRHNCDKCNNYEWNITPASFIRGRRCPKCNESKGEKAIDTFLSNNHINYKVQYTFSDCKNKNPLRFDFAVFDENNNLKLLIEFQGIQHYKYVDFFHKDDAGFVNRILSDGKKRAYCEYNNIPLLEIYDKDFENIETILKEKLFNIA